jgi:NAD(P)-dependent dehydrogenase (short-subunit alcohol dehydrogenase family)
MNAALVTGGAQGIGKGIAARLLRDGWAVLIADVDPEAGRDCLDEWDEPQRLRFAAADVADEAAVRDAVHACVEAFGGLHGLVNNAGIGLPTTPPEDLALSDWNRVLAVNLTGSFLAAKHAAPYLRAARGAIVNIASTRALQSEPGTEAYSASKGGVVALTHALAVSLGDAVRVNCISPGWIETGPWQKPARRSDPHHSDADRSQHPAGRVGIPEDIAALTAFLLSQQAEFITGQNYVVDGGMTRKMIYE